MNPTKIICQNCPKLQDKIASQANIIKSQQKQLAERDESIIDFTTIVAAQAGKIKELEISNNNLKKEAFGSKSEKGKKLVNTGAANDKSGDNDNCNKNKNKNKSSKNKKTRKKPNRKNTRNLPPELPRVPIDLFLPKEETICPCCGEELSILGTKNTEVLDIVPIILQVLEYKRNQYACKKCKSKEAMKIAPLPADHIKNSMASPKLLSWLIVNKYDYHFPLYRTSRLFKEYGYKVSDKTINSWVINTGAKFEYLYTKLIDLLVMQTHLFSDDTTVKLLVPGLHKTKTARLWVYTSKSIPIVIYDFTLTRKKENPHEFLKNFIGYLQTDAYQGYYALYKDDDGNIKVIPVYCIAHCRRKFFSIAELADKPGLAHEALKFINRLYSIESQIKDLSYAQKYDIRQDKAVPILQEFKTWVLKNKELVLEGTSISNAINYTFNHFDAFSNYCLDGRLEIDNNRSEQKMRGPKLGMNNYLFYGSEKGGLVAAILLSLIESCKANNISPMAWLEDVIPKLDYYTTTKISDLFPHVWAKQHQQLKPDKVAA